MQIYIEYLLSILTDFLGLQPTEVLTTTIFSGELAVIFLPFLGVAAFLLIMIDIDCSCSSKLCNSLLNGICGMKFVELKLSSEFYMSIFVLF